MKRKVGLDEVDWVWLACRHMWYVFTLSTGSLRGGDPHNWQGKGGLEGREPPKREKSVLNAPGARNAPGGAAAGGAR